MIRSLLTLTLSLTLWLPIAAAAAQRIDVQPDQTVRVRMSRDTPNRVAMDEGLRLSAVWGNKAQVRIQKDEKAGQAIVQPLTDEPFSLFVTDETQSTYSLLVVPEPIPGEQVILRPQAILQQQRFDGENAMPYKRRIKDAVRDLAEGRTPRGFNVRNTPESLTPLYAHTTLNLERVFAGGRENIEQLVLVNTGTEELVIEERDFKADPMLGRGLLAVGVRQLVLQPQEQTRVWLVRKGAR